MRIQQPYEAYRNYAVDEKTISPTGNCWRFAAIALRKYRMIPVQIPGSPDAQR
jgi:hypothetical protein